MIGIDWSLTYILSQILTVAEYGLLGASYQAKNRKLVVILDILSMALGIAVFLLLGADLGMLMSVVILLANFYYLWDEHAHGKRERSRLHARDYVVLIVVLGLIGVITWLTYDGPLSLLSVAATVLYEISIWQKSTRVYKFLGIPVAFCWMTYNGFVHSIFGVICELAMLVAAIVGYTKEYVMEKLRRKRLEARRRRQQRKALQGRKGRRPTLRRKGRK